MKYLLTYFLAVITALIGAYLLVAYVPLSYFPDVIKHTFGSTITTIQGSDTITASRSVINANFQALNTDKIEASVATLSSLTSIGTIATGVWNGTAVNPAYGGTGSTTLSSNQVILGNGTGAVKVVNGYGTTNQFLTSNGVGAAPSWTTGSVDQTQNYSWTGNHTFAGSATTTFVKGLYASLIAAPYLIATSTAATSTLTGLVFNNATTTNFSTQGGQCLGCLSGFHQVAKGAAGPTANNAITSVSVSCDTGKVVSCAASTTNVTALQTFLTNVYPDTPTSCTATYSCGGSGCNPGTISAIAECSNSI